jgi:hypothetical protein
MKKLLLLLTLSLCIYAGAIAQNKSDLIFSFGNNIGSMITYHPNGKDKIGFFGDYKFLSFSNQFNWVDHDPIVISSNTNYTWQTDYGSYTTMTTTRKKQIHETSRSTNTSISAGAVFPIGTKNNIRCYAGAGVAIKKIVNESFMNYYVTEREFTHLELAGYDYWNHEIYSLRDEDLPTVKIYEISPCLNGGIIWGSDMSFNAGFNAMFGSDGPKLQPYVGFGVRL